MLNSAKPPCEKKPTGGSWGGEGRFLDGFNFFRLAKKECEADRFAADMLIPAREYATFVCRNKEMSETVVSDFAQQVGMAPGIVVGRLQQDGHLPDTELNELKEELAWVEPC